MVRLPPTERAVGPAPDDPEPAAAPSPKAAQAIGPYRLVHLIGSGGMGEVWLAEQSEPVRRTVALKLVKRGMDTREVIARFQAERQALAMMDHPAIAKVFEAGETPRGRPFFAMEYVRGVPITDYCDRHRLTTRERLELFCEVCEGVQHAHHKAVIHRDLKPSNILVSEHEGRPAPKIIDFGVAKATAQRLTEETLYTVVGQAIGTPEYMSPEQADLTGEDIDTRTDVYALGVVLYQLLVGALPFDPKELRREGLDGVRRMLREQDPAKPSTRLHGLGPDSMVTASNRRTEPHALERQLSGDLDWVVMKALEKDRSRRYGSPHELAADIGRYLRNEPVVARPPTTLYRMEKFVRRHRAGVTVAAAMLVLLVAFAIAMAVQAGRIARERDRKESARAEAEAVTKFLSDMLGSVDPIKAGRDVTVRQILDRATADLGGAFAGRPAVEARLRDTIGVSYSGLGLYPPAQEQLEEAFRLRTEVLGAEHPDTLATGEALANIYFNRGRFEEAERLHRQVLEARRQVLGRDHDRTLWSVTNLAMTLAARGRNDEAEPLYQEVLAIRRRTLGTNHRETLALINNLAVLYHVERRYAEAEPLYREAIAGYETIKKDDPRGLNARNNLGELFADQGRPREAEPILADVLEVKKRVLGADHPSTLYTAGMLGRVYRAEGSLDRAEGMLVETLAGERRKLGDDHPQTLGTFHALACLRAAQGRRREAVELLAQALKPGLQVAEPFADPALAALAGDPEFERLRARHATPPA